MFASEIKLPLALRQQLAVYVTAGPSLLGRSFPVLASLANSPRCRSAGDRDPLAPRGLPRLLAMDLKARARSATDTRGDQGLDLTDGDRERLACPKDPGGAVEAWDPPRLDDHRSVLARGRRRWGFASAVDDVPGESPRLDRRNGLLRRSDRPLHAALRVVCPRPRKTACPSLQRHPLSIGSLGAPAVA